MGLFSYKQSVKEEHESLKGPELLREIENRLEVLAKAFRKTQALETILGLNRETEVRKNQVLDQYETNLSQDGNITDSVKFNPSNSPEIDKITQLRNQLDEIYEEVA